MAQSKPRVAKLFVPDLNESGMIRVIDLPPKPPDPKKRLLTVPRCPIHGVRLARKDGAVAGVGGAKWLEERFKYLRDHGTWESTSETEFEPITWSFYDMDVIKEAYVLWRRTHSVREAVIEARRRKNGTR